MTTATQPPEAGRLATLRARMVELQHSPGWETYLTALQEMERAAVAQLITATANDVSRLQGLIQGLRAAQNVPAQYMRS